MPGRSSLRRTRALLAALAASVAVTGCASGAVHVVVPDASGATRAICARLGDRLPTHLDGHRSRVVEPISTLTHAWGNPPIVLRCGVPKPAGYSPTSIQSAVVDGVVWFQEIGPKVVRWTAVRHQANLELTVPTSYDAQGAFLVTLAPAIKTAIP
ncbi:MAG TPA: DUF3515 domain-containing protein [Mycobacteriales bacterium]|nr:DUF3515 domain-containing protein [Mycobacteriales bacterium]